MTNTFSANYFCHLGKHGVATHHNVYQLTTGYGSDEHDNKSCFCCIGQEDRKLFLESPIGTKLNGYLSTKDVNGYNQYVFSNWPGSFSLNVLSAYKSRTNWNLKRTDFWFILKDEAGKKHYFWGKKIGEHNQVAYVRKVKSWK